MKKQRLRSIAVELSLIGGLLASCQSAVEHEPLATRGLSAEGAAPLAVW